MQSICIIELDVKVRQYSTEYMCKLPPSKDQVGQDSSVKASDH